MVFGENVGRRLLKTASIQLLEQIRPQQSDFGKFAVFGLFPLF